MRAYTHTHAHMIFFKQKLKSFSFETAFNEYLLNFSDKAKKKTKRRVSTVKSAKEEKRIFTSPELLVDSPALVCEDTLFSAPVTLISGTGTLIEELLVEENNEKEVG